MCVQIPSDITEIVIAHLINVTDYCLCACKVGIGQSTTVIADEEIRGFTAIEIDRLRRRGGERGKRGSKVFDYITIPKGIPLVVNGYVYYHYAGTHKNIGTYRRC